VIYVSRVVAGCGAMLWVGDVTSKLLGFCGCVHGASERRSGVSLLLFFCVVCCYDVYDFLRYIV
jgi:hypothetical protein